MPSRTSCFNGLFRKDLTRFWPIWAAYVILWFLILPLTLISQMRQPHMYSDPHFVQNIAHNVMGPPAIFMAFFFSIIVAMAVFSYLYQGRSTNFFHALPVRRERQFLSHCASGLFMLLSGNVVIFLLSLLSEAGFGYLNAVSLLQWLAIACLCDVAFFGFAAFCAMLTGHILALPCIYVILQLAFVVAEMLIQYILGFFIFGLSALQTRLTFLSPCVMMVSKMGWHYEYVPDTGELLSQVYQGWGIACIYCVVGIVFLALALALYRHRRMEASSDVIAIRVLKPVFRWCMAVAGALCVASLLCLILFDNSSSGKLPDVLGIVFLLIGGFIGWVVADILLKKSFRVFRGHWKGFGIFAVVVIVLSLICQHGAFGYENRVPLPEEVASVTLSSDVGWNPDVTLKEPENVAAVVALHESILDNKAIHQAPQSSGTCIVKIIYWDEAGKPILQRSYRLSADDEQCTNRGSDLRTTERLLNVQEALRDRCTTEIEVRPDTILNAYLYKEYDSDQYPISYDVPAALAEYALSSMPGEMDSTLTDTEAYELYTQCILPDMEDGNMGQVWLIEDADFAHSVLNVAFAIELTETLPEMNYDTKYEDLHLQIPATAERTVRWLEEHGYDTSILWDAAMDYGDAYIYPAY